MFRPAITIAALLFLVPVSHAADLEKPAGDVILTISGQIGMTNAQDGAQFDREMLEALPQHTVETTTPWHEGMMKFEGPRIADIMAKIDASGESVEVTALDDYQTDVPFADFADHSPILALKRNGEYMPEDDQGPLFIIYDYDSDPALNTEDFHSRSVWSVKTMEVQ